MKHLFTSNFSRLLLVCAFGLLFSGAKSDDDHKFHFSFTVIRENLRTNTIEVEMKFFTDDLERILEEKYKPDFNLGAENELADVDDYIKEYIQTHFQLVINDRPIHFSFIGKEVDYDVTWCYLEMIRPPDVNIIQVTNTCLMDLYEDQTNDVDFRFNGWIKRVTLTEKINTETVFH